jgi:hypothetical protein
MGGCWSCAISSTPSSASSIEQRSARLPGCQTSQILLPSHHGFAGTSHNRRSALPRDEARRIAANIARQLAAVPHSANAQVLQVLRRQVGKNWVNVRVCRCT